VQRGAGGIKDAKVWRGAQQVRHLAPRLGQELLEVIQQQELLSRGQVVREGVSDRLARAFGEPECRGDGRRDELRAPQRREVDERHAVRELARGLGRDLEGQPRLADPSRTDERHEPMRLQEPSDLGDLRLPAEEGRRLDGQVVELWVEALYWRELVPQVGMDELEDVLGLAQILEPVRAEVAERGAFREAVGRELGRNFGEQRLLAPCQRLEPRGAEEGGAEVVIAAPLDLPGMHGDPDRQKSDRSPVLGGQRALHVDAAATASLAREKAA